MGSMEVNPDVELVFFILVLLMIPVCISMNILVIGIIIKKHVKSLLSIRPKTVILYFNLAISDTIMGLVAMPWVLYYIQIKRPSSFLCSSGLMNCTWENDTAHIGFCNFSGYGYNVATRVTSLVILILSIDRFHAIYFPTTYSQPVFARIYSYSTYMIWGFALGTSALPFLVGLTYQEQPTRELMCSWSITELLGIQQAELMNNRHQILFPYIVLNFFPVVVPSLASVVLSGAVFCRLVVKRVEYIIGRHGNRNRRQTLKSIFNPAEEIRNLKLKQLTKASVTMLYLVLLYIVSYAYWWFIITIGTVFLGGAYVPLIQERNNNLSYQYVNNSYSMTAFLNSTISPFIVYFRVFKPRKSKLSSLIAAGSQKVPSNGMTTVDSNPVIVQVATSKVQLNRPYPIDEHFV